MSSVNAVSGVVQGVDLDVGQYLDARLEGQAAPQAVRKGRTRHRQFAVKRAFDLVAAVVLLLILLPSFLFLLVAIPLESRGSPIFTQLRWGRDGRKIRVFKFRTMRSDLGDPTGVQQTVKGDPRTTRLGAWLRRLNVDELPQLVNVLLGDMSLVGPRCHPIGMLGAGMLYEDLVPNYHERHAVRPGITGLAQMRGFRGPTSDPELASARIANDLEYIREFSLWLDVKILFGTVVGELRGGRGF